METLETLTFLLVHIDQALESVIETFGIWSYLILFIVLFAETGFVITPFLPGDSLLFAAGVFAALGDFNILILFITVFIAAVLGDSVNYWIGNKFGEKVLSHSKYVNKKHIKRTEKFFDKNGGKTIILARFVPIVRTFAPFVAGIGAMEYPKFFLFNVVGGFLWTGLFVSTGFFFGGVPFVKDNFELVIVMIVLISLVPIVIEYFKNRHVVQTS